MRRFTLAAQDQERRRSAVRQKAMVVVIGRTKRGKGRKATKLAVFRQTRFVLHCANRVVDPTFVPGAIENGNERVPKGGLRRVMAFLPDACIHQCHLRRQEILGQQEPGPPDAQRRRPRARLDEALPQTGAHFQSQNAGGDAVLLFRRRALGIGENGHQLGEQSVAPSGLLQESAKGVDAECHFRSHIIRSVIVWLLLLLLLL